MWMEVPLSLKVRPSCAIVSRISVHSTVGIAVCSSPGLNSSQKYEQTDHVRLEFIITFYIM